MIALFEQYSISEILIFTFILALAIKSLISFFDWAIEKLRKIFNKEHKRINQKEEIEKRLKQENDIIKSLQGKQQKTDEILNDLTEKIDMLIESDKDAIRAYITKEHHYFCNEQKWIDDFSLDCIQRRFKHYEEQGGNSFIKNFMEDLRGLPNQPPNN